VKIITDVQFHTAPPDFKERRWFWITICSGKDSTSLQAYPFRMDTGFCPEFSKKSPFSSFPRQKELSYNTFTWRVQD
jgi:hypothetical protein